MDNLNQNQNNMMGSLGSVEPQKKSYGALIAVVIILILMIIGGLYFLGQRINKTPYQAGAVKTSDSVTQAMKSQSSSDNIAAIESDLKATSVSTLDQGASAFEAQMQ